MQIQFRQALQSGIAGAPAAGQFVVGTVLQVLGVFHKALETHVGPVSGEQKTVQTQFVIVVVFQIPAEVLEKFPPNFITTVSASTAMTLRALEAGRKTE